ncbi:MAG: peptide chain release factor 2 [Chloroflexi bacterium CFX6]|nr:peptide chain release factor 2 [Chloroflexi bacterium CFX6]
MESEADAIETQTLAPDFWSDPAAAQAAMRRLNGLRDDIRGWHGLTARIADAMELAPLVDAEADPAMAAEVEAEADAIERALDAAETTLLLSGPYDGHDAILSIHAGAGGTESQDWAEMLQRLYLRWADRHGFKTEIVDTTPGEEAGIKSTTLTIAGRSAYGLLRSERGVHRLVRISPFDASARRHTSFVLVEVSPVIEDDVSIEIRDEDLRVDYYRASGAGGQHVNKTSSAVRLVHLPTNVVVTCQNERSQAQNRDTAMKLLRARLLELELEKREAEQARIKGQHVEAGWGNQIRSYVLQPYQMVKDHRTGYESGRTQAVLDGEIDGFIDAYLRFQVGAKSLA